VVLCTPLTVARLIVAAQHFLNMEPEV
jgi:hypothetical protein